jgi:hypothetical protein
MFFSWVSFLIFPQFPASSHLFGTQVLPSCSIVEGRGDVMLL